MPHPLVYESILDAIVYIRLRDDLTMSIFSGWIDVHVGIHIFIIIITIFFYFFHIFKQ